jgi:hypothetical protein
MRALDLSVYADELAARAATLAAQLERAHGRLRRTAIESEARRALDEHLVARLEALDVLRAADTRAVRAEIHELAAALSAVEKLQTWVEERLFAAGEEISAA